MFATNRQGAHFSLDSTFLFDEMPSFRDTLTLAEPGRSERLRDPAVRERMRKEIADPTGRSFVFVWQVVAVETVDRPEHAELVGRTVWDIAQEQGKDPLDAFLDLSLAEDLRMQFVLAAPPSPKRRAVTETLIKSPVVMAGSSDGGAHLLSFCGADFTTRLISEWTPDVLPLEAAIARLTSIPAAAYGITDRGTLESGKAADVLLVDLEHLAAGDSPRYVRDFPAGSGRYVVDATAHHSVIVNGRLAARRRRHRDAAPASCSDQERCDAYLSEGSLRYPGGCDRPGDCDEDQARDRAAARRAAVDDRRSDAPSAARARRSGDQQADRGSGRDRRGHHLPGLRRQGRDHRGRLSTRRSTRSHSKPRSRKYPGPLAFEDRLAAAIEIMQQRVFDIWRLVSSVGTDSTR